MIITRTLSVALCLLALAPCQPSAARDATRAELAEKTPEAPETHSDCQEMPWNSAVSNCEAGYEAAASEKLVDQEFRKLLPAMDATDREWASQTWRKSDNEPTYRDAMVGSQSAWTAFRDAQCQIEMYEWRGGASEEQRLAICELRMNRERLAQLRQMLEKF